MKLLYNSKTMFKRNMKISFRNPDTMVMSIFAPTLMLLLFAYVFGGVMNVGDGINYVNFIITGIILQCIAQAAMTTAICINTDMNKGMIERFRSMPISKSSFLMGHFSAAIVRNVITVTIMIGVAFIVGFRPEASFGGWLVIIAMLLLFIMVVNWIAILLGLATKTPESAGSFVALISVLPFVSSGFAPTETMPAGIRWFAEYQPMTPIINTIRSMIMGGTAGTDLYIALAWCFGLLALMFALSLYAYKRKLSR
jgi:ABC-2 type transport system permease protein